MYITTTFVYSHSCMRCSKNKKKIIISCMHMVIESIKEEHAEQDHTKQDQLYIIFTIIGVFPLNNCFNRLSIEFRFHYWDFILFRIKFSPLLIIKFIIFWCNWSCLCYLK